MPVLISAHELSKSFTARPLFRGLTFSIESGDRIGLIGPNGAGKSTLLRVLSGQASPDEGTLSVQRGLKVGFLEQVPEFSKGATLLASLLEGAPHPEEWESQALAHELISKFHLDHFSLDTQLEEMSGGWKKRVALARELMKAPDLLLLDEPTNHLDVESILWLEELLASSRFAVLTITHDRLFLQRIANRILELDSRHAGGLLNIKGDYAAYLEAREVLISAQERREVILKNTLRRETEWLKRGAKARTTKQQARIQRHGQLQSEVEELGFRNQNRTAQIKFHSAEKNPKKLIEARALSKSYGDKSVFTELDLLITPGTRIGLLGKNGAGKSSLIRALLKLEPPTSGEVIHAEGLTIAYFDQTREALDPEISVAKTLCPYGDYVEYRGTKVHIRSYLDRFLFTQQQMDMKVGKLSGGEQSRLLIARLMLSSANLLVLDEPTNDLDLATLNVLEECLTDFSGAVILVTHDRYFLDQVANLILAFPFSDALSGQKRPLTAFADLLQWEEWHERERALGSVEKSDRQPSASPLKNDSSGVPKKKRKLSFKEQREWDSMEKNIEDAENTLAELTRESLKPENATQALMLADLTKKMSETQSKIDALYRRWAELETPEE